MTDRDPPGWFVAAILLATLAVSGLAAVLMFSPNGDTGAPTVRVSQ